MRKMKKWIAPLLCLVLTAVLFTGCGSSSGRSPAENGKEPAAGSIQGRLLYSNMTDQGTQDEIADRLTSAGIAAERCQAFFAMVSDYNALAGTLIEFQEGFTEHDGLSVDYGEDIWSEWQEQRSCIDADCMIAAMTLISDQISVGLPQALDSSLISEKHAIESYDLISFDEKECGRFAALFNPVALDPAADADTVLKAVQTEWAGRGISFEEGSVSLVSILLLNDTDSIGYISHTGVMLEDEDGVLFLEKLAPTKPYQALKFQSREEVKEYLAAFYDSFFIEQVVGRPPLFLVNDQAF